MIVSGCYPGDCHYTAGNYHARRRFAVFRELISFCGLDPRRLHFAWVSASEGAKWVDAVNDVTSEVRGVGPINSNQPVETGNVEEEGSHG